jgi:hypothetical protein
MGNNRAVTDSNGMETPNEPRVYPGGLELGAALLVIVGAAVIAASFLPWMIDGQRTYTAWRYADCSYCSATRSSPAGEVVGVVGSALAFLVIGGIGIAFARADRRLPGWLRAGMLIVGWAGALIGGWSALTIRANADGDTPYRSGGALTATFYLGGIAVVGMWLLTAATRRRRQRSAPDDRCGHPKDQQPDTAQGRNMVRQG